MSRQILDACNRILRLSLFFLFGEMTFAQLYKVTDLGKLPGGTNSRALAINNFGTVVGSSAGTADADYIGCSSGAAGKPFIWTAVGGMQVLLGPSPSFDTLGPCGG